MASQDSVWREGRQTRERALRACTQNRRSLFTPSPTSSISATGGQILHTCMRACMAAQIMGGIVISLRAQMPLKWSAAPKEKMDKGPEERKKAILLELVPCTNGEHGSASNSRTLERVCVLLSNRGMCVAGGVHHTCSRACVRSCVC